MCLNVHKRHSTPIRLVVEMASTSEIGLSKRGKQTLIFHNFEFWKYKCNKKGETLWRCTKRETFKCKATLKTNNAVVIGTLVPEHTHSGNVANALARQAVGKMKTHMNENVATPSASQGAVIVNLAGHVQMAIPKRASLSRVLRRHRQMQQTAGRNGAALPPVPNDNNFDIPERFMPFLLHDSGPGPNRILLFGDRELLGALARAQVWLADGTFKVVPTLFYQLYSIHFQFIGGLNPAAVYCLLPDKSRATYDRLLGVIKALCPTAAPSRILTDFESAAMNAFRDGFPDADISGCYFHLCQSVVRKVNECGLKSEYETDDEIQGFIRCLAALSHVPVDDVVDAFEQLVETMPQHDRVNDVATYFEHTYVRGRRRPGRGNNYGPAIFPIARWNQYESALDGIARTTNSVEGWHYSLQSLFLCQHPTMWTFLQGLERDSSLNKAAYLQTTTGVAHPVKKRYRDLKDKATRAVMAYGESDILTYLRAIAHLSHA
jgi:hypothetical protein